MSAPQPRSSAADGDDAQPGCALPLPLLPLAVLTHVLLRLPLDERLRLAEVCRGWRAMLRERSLWMHLDVSATSLGAACRASDALLRAGAARALRNVRSVDVSGVLRDGDGGGGGVSVGALCALAAQNPGLRVIRALSDDSTHRSVAVLRTLLEAAPRLTELHADACVATAADALPLLANAGPYGPLHLRRLRVLGGGAAALDDDPDAAVEAAPAEGRAAVGFFGAGSPSAVDTPPPAWLAALLDALPAHAARVTQLHLPRPGPRALRASVDAALALRLRGCGWGRCALETRSPLYRGTGGAEQLTRLVLNSDALTELRAVDLLFEHGGSGAADAHAAAALGGFCAALRASRLTSLTLRGAAQQHGCRSNTAAAAAAAVFCALAAALAGHPTLAAVALRMQLRTSLDVLRAEGATLVGLVCGAVAAPDALALQRTGAALAALAAAPAGALTRLDVSGCNFLDAELAPLFAALAGGAAPRLRALDVVGAQLRGNFLRAVVAPAAVAAASGGGSLAELRLTDALPHTLTDAAACGVERMVRARAAAACGRFVFRAHHVPLCCAANSDDFDVADAAAAAAAGTPPLVAPLARALAREDGLARVLLGGAFASALASGALRECDAAALLRALAGHPRMEALTLEGDLHASGEALGPALGALVAANAPALASLRVAGCMLGDAGMRPLVAALPANTHLRTLECGRSALSAAFAREALLPAARANTGLTQLSVGENALWGRLEAAAGAMACVRARSQQAPGASQQ
jgi:hypothetical protein